MLTIENEFEIKNYVEVLVLGRETFETIGIGGIAKGCSEEEDDDDDDDDDEDDEDDDDDNEDEK